MTNENYSEFFRKAMGWVEGDKDPYLYQERLATEPWPDLLNIPTGLGKTAAIVLAWIYKRRIIKDTGTPRRLVYCLPMRVLVEQTVENARTWLGKERLNVFGEPGEENRVTVNVLMGGDHDIRRPEWTSYPDQDAIIIGTQDMLLSRALMRGYGMSRYQWPVQFALLHNDALWVYDEVQLMGTGLSTSAQTEAFRRHWGLGKPARSLWASATLQAEWLATVDFRSHITTASTLKLGREDQGSAAKRLHAEKRLHRASVRLDADTAKQKVKVYIEDLARAVLDAHRAGSQSLVILNRVERTQALYRALRKADPDLTLLLLHARFRPAERSKIERALKDATAAQNRIVIATQAIEAGVDISSSVLFTELAPWPSMVQRFGRCNRYGECVEGADIYWIDINTEDRERCLPYEDETLAPTRRITEPLTVASLAALPPVESDRATGPIIRRKDFVELFNTDPDLSGFDIDVSPYIRDRGSPQVQVFWREFDDRPDDEPAPRREELCSVSMSQLSDYLGKPDREIRVWDTLAERWRRIDKSRLRPGLVLMLRARDGGYDPELGFHAAGKKPVTVVDPDPGSGLSDVYNSDKLTSIGRFVSLTEHLNDVAAAAEQLINELALSEAEAQAMVTAARWHDVGKAHAAFQNMVLEDAHDAELRRNELWAKSASNRKRPNYFVVSNGEKIPRRHFRHELASMLAWLEHGEINEKHDLIAYLIAAHHGRVRTGLRALPDERRAPNDLRYARGIWEADPLPEVRLNGKSVPPTELRLNIMELGLGEQGPSWTERTQRLLRELGPFRLAWLEALVRIADWRASRQEEKN